MLRLCVNNYLEHHKQRETNLCNIRITTRMTIDAQRLYEIEHGTMFVTRRGPTGKAPSSCHGRPGSPQVGTKTPGGEFASSGAQAHLSPPPPGAPQNHLPGPQRGSERAVPGPASLWSLHRASSPARHRASSPLIPLSSRSLSCQAAAYHAYISTRLDGRHASI